MSLGKEIHFKLPQTMWERFVQTYPETGARASFLRKAIGVAIECGEEKRRMDDMIEQKIRRLIDGGNGEIERGGRVGSERDDIGGVGWPALKRERKSTEDINGDEGSGGDEEDKWSEKEYWIGSSKKGSGGSGGDVGGARCPP